MADWTFYSPKLKLANVGELLREIPSNRIFRLERSFTESGQETAELVRAAEQLLDLDITIRLQNDPTGSMRLQVRLPSDADRRAFAALGRSEFTPKEVAVVAVVGLSRAAIEAGHLDLGDDVIAALSELFRRGIAHSPSTGEVLVASELARLLHSDARCSHIDLQLHCEAHEFAYVASELKQLPAPLGDRVRAAAGLLTLRSRVPLGLSMEEIGAICSVAVTLSRHAAAGQVRFRQRGVWSDAVAVGGGGAPPAEKSEGMFSRISRLLRSK